MTDINLSWTDFKAEILAAQLSFKYKIINNSYYVWAFDGDLSMFCQVLILDSPAPDGSDQQDFETNYQSKAVKFLEPKTADNRSILATNRIPPGYTIYPTGVSDNIISGTYGDGYDIKMDDSNVGTSNKATVQFLQHWYGIGGRIIWESATLADSVSAMLVAPASTGLTQATGDYTKYALGGPYHIILPVTAGTGDWSINLTSKLSNTSILKCTPVPAAGNNGWFDYDSDANALTRNMTQTGGYNLYDFDINLFRFARKIWGRKMDGAESMLETTDVVGKLLYNSWQIRFQLDNVTAGVKCGAVITTAMKKNI